jgi:hypothetical protein
MQLEAIFERLAADNIQILPAPDLNTHFLLERDGFVSLVERTPNGFGKSGTPGILTETGIAQLIWRNNIPYFVARNAERIATPEEVDQLRHFSRDLNNALNASDKPGSA